MGPNGETRSEIAFFDVETTVPTRQGQGRAILEFGAILVCPLKLQELQNYSTLVRPSDPSLISSLSVRCNGITPEAVSSAPSFGEVADKVYDILHGRIWAGHNILTFDCPRIKEAFDQIGRPAPEPKGTFDSLALLTQRFGRRAGDMKMATLATYFGLGQQKHRSLDDVRMNLEVVKYCATVLFVESSLPDIFSGSGGFLEPEEIFTYLISASLVPSYRGTQRIRLLHNGTVFQLCCSGLRVRFGIDSFPGHGGRPKFSFVVDLPPTLCQILSACNRVAHKLSIDSGSSSEWKPVISRKYGSFNTPTARLQMQTIDADGPRFETEIYRKESSGAEEKLYLVSVCNAEELKPLINPGTFVDTYFSLDPYDYQQHAGIRLVAKKLIIHSK